MVLEMAMHTCFTLLVIFGMLDAPSFCLCRQQTESNNKRAALPFYRRSSITDEYRNKKGPDVVVFHASLSSDTSNFGTPTKVAFDHVRTNAGNSYNGRNGVFTAPVDGFYSFTIMLTAKYEAKLFLMLDGWSVQYAVSHGYWESGTSTTNLKLKPGDKVWVELIGMAFGENCWYSWRHGPAYKCYHSTFSGFLISRI